MAAAGLAPSCAKISLVLADFDSLLTQEFDRAIASEPAFDILDYPARPAALKETLAEQRPAILLVQSATLRSTLATLTMAHKLSPSTRSVVLSSGPSRHEIVSFFHAQARGILCPDSVDATEVRKCICSVHQGQIWASNLYLGYLVESLSRAEYLQTATTPAHSALSTREAEVVRLLALGLSNRDLAMALGLSEHTIKNHLFHIFGKLGVSSRAEALLFAKGQQEAPNGG